MLADVSQGLIESGRRTMMSMTLCDKQCYKYESANNVVSDYQAEEMGSLVLKLAQMEKRTYKKLSEFTVERADFQMNSWRENLGGGLFILSICSCGCLANEMTGFPLVGCRITCFLTSALFWA
jgi:hypothetical protein